MGNVLKQFWPIRDQGVTSSAAAVACAGRRESDPGEVEDGSQKGSFTGKEIDRQADCLRAEPSLAQSRHVLNKASLGLAG